MRLFELSEVRWAAASLVLFVTAVASSATGAPSWVVSALFVACYVAGGWEPAAAGLAALRERRLDVDLLMVVAAVAAFAIGEAFDGGLLIVIFATSGALEALATKRTQDAVRSLLHLAPERATIVTDAGEVIVETATLVPGDVTVVRPGERIGADGRVVEGASDVDQASITGEPLPATKLIGDEVFAGTVNGTGTLKVRVERAAVDSVVARIVTQVEQASATKARTQLFIETVEQRYSLVVVAATIALLAIPLVAGAESTLLRAMTFMIVASPCALVLATMPPLLSAIALASRNGVLVKNAVVMEQLGRTSVVLFDKTGTLTEGAPQVTDTIIDAGAAQTERSMLRMAAAAELPSEHPVGRAIVTAARTGGIDLPSATMFESVPGVGVHAVVEGRNVTVKRPDQIAGWVEDAVNRIQGDGGTAVIVTIDGDPSGVIGVADRVRDRAHLGIRRCARLTSRSPVVVSGDNTLAARRLAAELGVGDVHAELLPHHKVDHVIAFRAHGHVTAVGDGVNDAPMLAAAGTGVAMGRNGADLALETADVVLVRDDLAALPAAIELSRRARRVVMQNLAFAGTVIVALVTIDLVGQLPLPLGVAGHEGSTIVVALNGLRLLSRRSWPEGDPGPMTD